MYTRLCACPGLSCHGSSLPHEKAVCREEGPAVLKNARVQHRTAMALRPIILPPCEAGMETRTDVHFW